MNLKDNFDGTLTCALNVSDIKASIQWYQEVLGFEVVYHVEGMKWCELKSPVNNVTVGLGQVEILPSPGGNAVLTWGVKDVEAAKKDLESKSVKFEGDICNVADMVKLATFYDPDGNCFMLAQLLSSPH